MRRKGSGQGRCAHPKKREDLRIREQWQVFIKTVSTKFLLREEELRNSTHKGGEPPAPQLALRKGEKGNEKRSKERGVVFWGGT